MGTTAELTRRTRSKAVLGCLTATLAILVTSCGGSEPTADEARSIMMADLADSGVDRATAACIADTALERHEPGELVNTSGEASDEVNASIAEIVVECTTPVTTAPPPTTTTTTTIAHTTTVASTTTAPSTTIAATTVPETTEPDVDLAAFCTTSEDVYIALLAADQMPGTPAPATLEAFFNELIDRIQLAIVTAPEPEYAKEPNTLLDAVEAFQAELEAVDFDVDAVPEDALQDEADTINETQDALEEFLGTSCESDTDLEAEATELADELIALGGDDPDGPGEGARTAESDDVHIRVDVPATWTSELDETVDGRRVFTVAIDAESFRTSWGVDGVRITGIDEDVDLVALMDDTDAARECTLISEEPYDDGLYVGSLRRYEECGEASEAVVIGASENEADITALVEFQMVEFDQAALELVTDSFLV